MSPDSLYLSRLSSPCVEQLRSVGGQLSDSPSLCGRTRDVAVSLRINTSSCVIGQGCQRTCTRHSLSRPATAPMSGVPRAAGACMVQRPHSLQYKVGQSRASPMRSSRLRASGVASERERLALGRRPFIRQPRSDCCQRPSSDSLNRQSVTQSVSPSSVSSVMCGVRPRVSDESGPESQQVLRCFCRPRRCQFRRLITSSRLSVFGGHRRTGSDTR